MHARLTRISILVLALACCWPAPRAQAVQLADLAAVITAASNALEPLLNFMTTAVRKMDDGVITILERLSYDDLKELSALTTDLLGSQQIVVESLEQYVNRPKPENWPKVIERLDAILGKVENLLAKVRKERSDFINEPTYSAMSESLQKRAELLSTLKSQPAPTSPEEIKTLRDVSRKYAQLIRQLRNANQELGDYLKSHKPA